MDTLSLRFKINVKKYVPKLETKKREKNQKIKKRSPSSEAFMLFSEGKKLLKF